MKAIFRILGTAAAVAATGAAIVIMDKLLNEKAAPIIEIHRVPRGSRKGRRRGRQDRRGIRRG